MPGISTDLFKQPVNSKALLIKPGGPCMPIALVAGDHKSPPCGLHSLSFPHCLSEAAWQLHGAWHQVLSEVRPQAPAAQTLESSCSLNVLFPHGPLHPWLGTEGSRGLGYPIRSNPLTGFQAGFLARNGYGDAPRQQMQP